MKNLIDLHTHTIACGHAYSTLLENVAQAKIKGIEVLGLSDHAPTLPGAAHIYFFQNMKVIPDYIDGIRILKGAEVNIIDFEGRIDLEPFVLNELDYAIASLHPPTFNGGTIEQNTAAVINAMKHAKVKIMGHLDDGRYPLNYEAIVQAAKAHHCLIEINNASLHPKSFRQDARKNAKTIIDYCKQYDMSVIMSSDAHICFQIGEVDYALSALEEANFPTENIVNFKVNDLERYLQ